MKNFIMNEDGQGMVEYGLILALIALAAIAVVGGLGGKVKAIFNGANDALSDEAVSGSGIHF